MTVYIAPWNTESGDDGVAGYWTVEPTEQELEAYFREHFEDEFVDGYSYIYWKLVELTPIKSNN